jgi:hypothetical protein
MISEKTGEAPSTKERLENGFALVQVILEQRLATKIPGLPGALSATLWLASWTSWRPTPSTESSAPVAAPELPHNPRPSPPLASART